MTRNHSDIQRLKKYSKESDSTFTYNGTRCIEWQGSRNKLGYGRTLTCNNGKRTYWSAHRFAYHLLVGNIGDKCVLHHCDNPSCVNTEHLYLGTQKDNARDREFRRRSQIGEDHYNSKYSEHDICMIKFYDDRPYKEIAADYGIPLVEYVGRIKRGQIWKHIRPDMFTEC